MSNAVLEEHNLHTRTGIGLFRSKPWQQILALQLSEQLYQEALGKARNGVPGLLTLGSVVLYLQRQLSVKPSVHLHSTAKKTKQLPDLLVWLQTTPHLSCPSKTEVVFQ